MRMEMRGPVEPFPLRVRVSRVWRAPSRRSRKTKLEGITIAVFLIKIVGTFALHCVTGCRGEENSTGSTLLLRNGSALSVDRTEGLSMRRRKWEFAVNGDALPSEGVCAKGKAHRGADFSLTLIVPIATTPPTFAQASSFEEAHYFPSIIDLFSHDMMAPQDLELASRATGPSKGFAAVASKIAHDPDKSTTIYRRFDWLSARNLLFYQAELAELEEVQRRYDEEDRKARDETSIECQRDWEKFAKCAEEDGREKRRMDLAMNIRIKLEKYHTALEAHQKLLNSTPSPATTVKAMRNWFFNNEAGIKCGDKLPQLWGASEQIYDDVHDLVALRVPTEHDRLSEFIQNNFGLFFRTSKPTDRQAYISSSRLTTFTAILSTILASILLFGAIISLYIVQNKHALLGMISGWTVLFAACVGLLTNAQRDQIFAATAAYAAVLVVFVSGNLGGATGSCTCAPG